MRRPRDSAATLLPTAPALFQPFHKPPGPVAPSAVPAGSASRTGRMCPTAKTATAKTSRPSRAAPTTWPTAWTTRPAAQADTAAAGDAAHVPPAGKSPHGAGKHDHEAANTDKDDLRDHACQQKTHTEQESDRGFDHPPLVMDAGILRAHGLRKLGIVGIERLLDLLELALLVLRQRHSASHEPHARVAGAMTSAGRPCFLPQYERGRALGKSSPKVKAGGAREPPPNARTQGLYSSARSSGGTRVAGRRSCLPPALRHATKPAVPRTPVGWLRGRQE